MWRTHFWFMKFRATSTHAVCTECLRHKMLLRELGHHLEARRSQQSLYGLHLKSQYADRVTYWTTRGKSRTRNNSWICAILDGMDQAKFQYPRSEHAVFQAKDMAGFIRPRAHITCMIMHGYGTLFTISPSDVKKDSSTMADILMHGLHLLARDCNVDLKQIHFNLQTDNTSRECKNNTTVRLFSWVISHGRLPSWLCFGCLLLGAVGWSS